MANRKKGGAAHRSFLALPRLRAGHGLQAPVTSQWTENDRALALISRSIDVLNSAEKGHSIPDIFSQSIQFEFDLGIGNARAVEQWQGLLATLLLAGAGGQARVRPLDMDALGDAPFARIFRAVAARRGIEGMTLFELRRTDGSWGAVAFRFAGMPTMLCPAAEIRGPFVVDDPWLRQTERGWTFDAPLALVDDPRYGERRLALRNEIYALATREIPARENRDGLQMIRLRAFFEFLSRGGDGISPYPVNAEVRAALFTQDAAAARPSSPVFTDRICLLREGNAYNRIHACAVETMRIFTGAQDSGWRALLPLRRAFAERELDKLRAGTLRVATKFPHIASGYYASRSRDIDLIKLNGSIEIAPVLGMSDVIVDIVETGKTLLENDLRPYETVAEISARLIANKASYRFKYDRVKQLASALAGEMEGEI